MKTDYDYYLSEGSRNIPRSFIREILETAEQPGIISFAGGLPNPRLFPVEPIYEAARYIFSHSSATSTLQYGGSQGYRPLREWIAERYSAKYKLSITPEMILLTNGSQQAVDLLAKTLINPGDVLMLEKPSYLGAIQCFSAYRPRFNQITMDDDGIDLNTLKEDLEKTGSHLLYSIPNFQNPSGISYSLERRKGVSVIQDYYNMLIIEDDPYGEIRFEGENLPSIYSLNPDKTIWCGSFSKMISPGIRLGWICAPLELMQHLLRAKQAADLHTNNVVQRLIHTYLIKNNIDDHLQKIREAYKIQKDSMVRCVQQYFPQGTKHTNPQGGMFLWVTLPDGLSSEELIKPALNDKKVVFVPGRSFYTSGNEGDRSMRLNFSNSSVEEIEEGMKRLGSLIKEADCKRNPVNTMSV
jgi:2-aminoadipate transaminase